MEPFLGMIQAFGYNFSPRGWAFCNGQILQISQYSALFSLLGTTFGGNGQTTFGLPDLRGRVIVGAGSGPGLTPVAYGEMGGVESVTLLTSNMPMHNHQIVNGNGQAGTVAVSTTVQTVNNSNSTSETDNGSNVLGTSGSMLTIYRESPSGSDFLGGVTSSITGTTSAVGSNTPVNIRNPYLGVYYSIALEGIFPSRN
jgi:microcystin-dependent protein